MQETTVLSEGFTCEQLDENHVLYRGQLPDELMPSQEQFEQLWNLHPAEYHKILMWGKPIKTPRWQQAYGKDYHYTSRTNKALPVPENVQPFLNWTRHTIDMRLNGVLFNWYAGELGHYIGKHRGAG